MKLRIFSDYIWPFCWIGKGLVDEFKDEFNIKDKWLPYELEPETPPEGRLLTDKFQPYEITAMFKNLRQRGHRYGMVYNDHDRASNSHLALLAGEFAKESGGFEEFHEKVFQAFFTDSKDIGQLDVILGIVSKSGMNPEKLKQALNDNLYRDCLNTTMIEARQLGIRSIPAFVFENNEIIMGALTPEVFKRALESIQDGTYIKSIL